MARMAGDPRDPLIIYLHGAGAGSDSSQWNGLVVALAEEIKRTKRELDAGRKP